jgi:hypothetical protein
MPGSLHVAYPAYSVQLAAGLDAPVLRGDGVCGTNGWTPPQDSCELGRAVEKETA